MPCSCLSLTRTTVLSIHETHRISTSMSRRVVNMTVQERKLIVRDFERLNDARAILVQDHVANLLGEHDAVIFVEDIELDNPLLRIIRTCIDEATHGDPGREQFENDRDAFLARVCKHCGSAARVTACARCVKVYYCNSQCQSADWARHKVACKKRRRDSSLTAFHRLPCTSTIIDNNNNLSLG